MEKWGQGKSEKNQGIHSPRKIERPRLSQSRKEGGLRHYELRTDERTKRDRRWEIEGFDP